MMKRRDHARLHFYDRSFLPLTALLPTPLALLQADDAPRKQPNIIFVVADDMGWRQTGTRGHPVLRTPQPRRNGGERASLRAVLCWRNGQ